MGSPLGSRALKTILAALLLLSTLLFSLAAWNRSKSNPAMAALTKGELTGLRVWGAGMRTGEGFCGCALVPKPERVFYETTNRAEIRAFVGLIQPRYYLLLEPPTENCSQVTIDFVRSGKPFSIHLKGRDLITTLGVLPVTSGSYDAIEEWLKQRSVRENISAALNRAPLK